MNAQGVRHDSLRLLAPAKLAQGEQAVDGDLGFSRIQPGGLGEHGLAVGYPPHLAQPDAQRRQRQRLTGSRGDGRPQCGFFFCLHMWKTSKLDRGSAFMR